MSAILRPPRRLERGDRRDGFHSGADELDDWFVRFAWENQQAGNAVTYVAMLDGVVLGYYALAMGSYETEALPQRLRPARPRQTPCVLLARLAVDKTAQRQGVGAALLRDAIERAYGASQAVGAAALLIHCRDTEAMAFYQANGDFLVSPVEPTHLFLSLKAMRRLVKTI
jgi:GNAT superfamily N-acetyltransferase